MNALDWVLLLFVVLYALSGYQQGFIVGSASTFGLLVGGFIGVQVTPLLLDGFDPGAVRLARGAAARAGLRIRRSGLGGVWRRTAARPGHLAARRVLDARRRGGAERRGHAADRLGAGCRRQRCSTCAGSTRRCARRRCCRASTTCCRAAPTGCSRPSTRWSTPRSSRATSSRSRPSGSRTVPAPTSGVVARPGVERARASVVKILGSADACGRSLEGSGFVFADRPGDDERPRRRGRRAPAGAHR